MTSRVLKNNLKFVLFSEIYYRLEGPKAKRQALALIESAIDCYARKGLDQTSLEMIARHAGCTRSVFKYYFADADEIKIFALKYIRAQYQQLTIDALGTEQEPKKVLLAYVAACLIWTDQFRRHVSVWLSFLQKCSRDKKLKHMNSIAVTVGTERLQAMIENGVAGGVFQCANTAVAARALQVAICGAVISLATEEHETLKQATARLQTSALLIVGETRAM